MPRTNTRRWRLLAAVLALGLIAAACGDDDGGDGTTSTSGEPTSTTEAAAAIPDDMPTHGVSDGEVTVGVLLYDTRSLTSVSGGEALEPEELQANVQFWVDWVNENGGIAGHQVNPVYSVIEAADPQGTQPPACLELTEDTESFLVTGFAANVECYTVDHETIYVTTAPTSADTLEASGPFLLQWQLSPERVMQSLVRQLDEAGELEGRTIGVVTDGRPASVAGLEATKAELMALGYESVADATLSATDPAAGQAAIPLEVTKFREAEVDLVIWPGTAVYGPGWTGEAAEQGWAAQYAFSELNGGTALDSYPGWPTDLNAIGYSSQDQPMDSNAGNEAPTSPLSDHCREIYEDATGEDYDPNSPDPSVRAEYGAKIGICRDWVFFHGIGESIEGDLTASAFMQGIADFDDWDFFVRPPGGSWEPGRAGIANSWRRVEWLHPCPVDPEGNKPGGCWVATSQFEPMPEL